MVMRAKADVMIGGNHDLACLGKIDLSDFNPDARTANIWNGKQLEDANRAVLDVLPPMLEVDKRFLVAHGSPRERSGDIYPRGHRPRITSRSSITRSA